MNEDLKYIRGVVDGLREDVTQIRVDVGKLQVKASLWGSLAGAIGAVGVLLAKFVLFAGIFL